MQFPDMVTVLGELPWCAVGAAATRMYMPERMTDDLDILVHDRDSADIEKKLIEAGYVRGSNLSIGGSSWQSPQGFPVDVLTSGEPWVRAAIAEAGTNRDAQSLPVLPMPYLVMMKFTASRVQDIADITRMLGQAADGELTAVRHAFARWLPGNDEDLESLISLGQLEFRSA